MLALVVLYCCTSLQPSVQTLQDTAHFTEEQLQPDDTTLQSGFIMDISKGSLSMEAPGLGVCWGVGGGGGCLCGWVRVGLGLVDGEG